jgi:hypothetical protein
MAIKKELECTAMESFPVLEQPAPIVKTHNTAITTLYDAAAMSDTRHATLLSYSDPSERPVTQEESVPNRTIKEETRYDQYYGADSKANLQSPTIPAPTTPKPPEPQSPPPLPPPPPRPINLNR